MRSNDIQLATKRKDATQLAWGVNIKFQFYEHGNLTVNLAKIDWPQRILPLSIVVAMQFNYDL